MKQVIFVGEEKYLLRRLFDLDISAHGQIDDGRCNIARMNAVVEQSARLSRRDSGRRLVHGSYGESRVRVASLVPPQGEHPAESDQREKHNGIAAEPP